MEPALRWQHVDGPSTEGVVTINLASGDEIVMSTRATDGQAFCIAGDASSGVGSGGVIRGSVDATGATTVSDCSGTPW
jgi:hypothetical protein